MSNKKHKNFGIVKPCEEELDLDNLYACDFSDGFSYTFINDTFDYTEFEEWVKETVQEMNLDYKHIFFKYMQNNAQDIEPLKPTRVNTWYNVYDILNRSNWAFCVNQQGIVIDASDKYYRSIVGKNYKPNTNEKLIVSEIGKLVYYD